MRSGTGLTTYVKDPFASEDKLIHGKFIFMSLTIMHVASIFSNLRTIGTYQQQHRFFVLSEGIFMFTHDKKVTKTASLSSSANGPTFISNL